MTAASTPGEVTHAITMKGAQRTWAILNGRKVVENRPFRLRAGWYALHTGLGELSVAERARLEALVPDVPRAEALPRGEILGLIRVDGGVRPAECKQTPAEPWATGPVCNLISEVLVLGTPVRHKGMQGVWPLSAAARASLSEQVARLDEQLRRPVQHIFRKMCSACVSMGAYITRKVPYIARVVILVRVHIDHRLTKIVSVIIPSVLREGGVTHRHVLCTRG